MLAAALQYRAPRVADVLELGGEREEWERLFDEAPLYRWDEAVLRDMENHAQREAYERALPYVPIASRGRGRATRRLGNSAQTLTQLFRAGFRSSSDGVRDSRYDASNYTIDGVSSKVATLVDYIDAARNVAQSTSANQVVAPAADAVLGNALCVAFAGGQFYVSNQAPAVWNHQHNGTGGSFVYVWKPTSVAGTQAGFATMDGGTPTGRLFYADSTDNLAVYVFASGSVISTIAGGAVVANTPTYAISTYSLADGMRLWQKTTSLGTAIPGTPTAADCTQAFELGRRGATNLLYMTASWRAGYWYGRVLEAAYLAVVRRWIQLDTGLV